MHGDQGLRAHVLACCVILVKHDVRDATYVDVPYVPLSSQTYSIERSMTYGKDM